VTKVDLLTSLNKTDLNAGPFNNKYTTPKNWPPYFTLIVMKTKYNETKRVQTRILRYTLKMLAIQVYVYNINNVGDDLL